MSLCSITLPCPEFKDCLCFSSPEPASVVQDARLVLGRGELVVVVADELDGLEVVPGPLVVPGNRVDAGVGEDLAGLLTEEAEKLELDWTHRVVSDLKIGERPF